MQFVAYCGAVDPSVITEDRSSALFTDVTAGADSGFTVSGVSVLYCCSDLGGLSGIGRAE